MITLFDCLSVWSVSYLVLTSLVFLCVDMNERIDFVAQINRRPNVLHQIYRAVPNALLCQQFPQRLLPITEEHMIRRNVVMQSQIQIL